jgi:hypothetical protein
MAQKIIRVGKWYLLYEVASTAAILGFAFFGIDVPALVG